MSFSLPVGAIATCSNIIVSIYWSGLLYYISILSECLQGEIKFTLPHINVARHREVDTIHDGNARGRGESVWACKWWPYPWAEVTCLAQAQQSGCRLALSPINSCGGSKHDYSVPSPCRWAPDIRRKCAFKIWFYFFFFFWQLNVLELFISVHFPAAVNLTRNWLTNHWRDWVYISELVCSR